MKKESGSVGVDPTKEPTAMPGDWKKICPTLTEYVSDPYWEDGTRRSLGWVSIRAKNGKWIGELQDPNYLRQLVVEVDLPQQVLPALETCLQLANTPWRAAEWLVKFQVKGVSRKRA